MSSSNNQSSRIEKNWKHLITKGAIIAMVISIFTALANLKNTVETIEWVYDRVSDPCDITNLEQCETTELKELLAGNHVSSPIELQLTEKQRATVVAHIVKLDGELSVSNLPRLLNYANAYKSEPSLKRIPAACTSETTDLAAQKPNKLVNASFQKNCVPIKVSEFELIHHVYKNTINRFSRDSSSINAHPVNHWYYKIHRTRAPLTSMEEPDPRDLESHSLRQDFLQAVIQGEIHYENDPVMLNPTHIENWFLLQSEVN